MHLDDLDASVGHLRSAIRLADRAGSADQAAEARMRLAFVLSIRGRPHQGMREIAAVLPDLRGPARARADAQRAAIFNLLGQFDDALIGYRTAVPALRRPPQLVVLAACDIGRPVVPAGDELLGLSAAFIAQGTRQIIASVTAIPDTQATHLMIAFHRALAAGIPAASALAQTQQRLATEDAATMATAVAFVCIGGEYSLAAPG